MNKTIRNIDTQDGRGNIKINTDRGYFSVTGEFGRYRGDWAVCGCCHETILAARPDLAPLVALHLATLDGVPMHAVENGYYWLAGALGGLGERFHGGNGSDARDAFACRKIAADHFRVSDAQIGALMEQVKTEGKKAVEIFCEARKTIWKAEALAALEMIANLPE